MSTAEFFARAHALGIDVIVPPASSFVEAELYRRNRAMLPGAPGEAVFLPELPDNDETSAPASGGVDAAEGAHDPISATEDFSAAADPDDIPAQLRLIRHALRKGWISIERMAEISDSAETAIWNLAENRYKDGNSTTLSAFVRIRKAFWEYRGWDTSEFRSYEDYVQELRNIVDFCQRTAMPIDEITEETGMKRQTVFNWVHARGQWNRFGYWRRPIEKIQNIKLNLYLAFHNAFPGHEVRLREQEQEPVVMLKPPPADWRPLDDLLPELRQRIHQSPTTVEVLAALSGISAPTIEAIRDGVTQSPHYRTLKRIERALDEVDGRDEQTKTNTESEGE